MLLSLACYNFVILLILHFENCVFSNSEQLNFHTLGTNQNTHLTQTDWNMLKNFDEETKNLNS